MIRKFDLPAKRSLTVAALFAFSGCGYIGEPMYPLLNIPARFTDLAAIQRGAVIIF